MEIASLFLSTVEEILIGLVIQIPGESSLTENCHWIDYQIHG
jgi:hypothetical protein